MVRVPFVFPFYFMRDFSRALTSIINRIFSNFHVLRYVESIGIFFCILFLKCFPIGRHSREYSINKRWHAASGSRVWDICDLAYFPPGRKKFTILYGTLYYLSPSRSFSVKCVHARHLLLQLLSSGLNKWSPIGLRMFCSRRKWHYRDSLFILILSASFPNFFQITLVVLTILKWTAHLVNSVKVSKRKEDKGLLYYKWWACAFILAKENNFEKCLSKTLFIFFVNIFIGGESTRHES